MGDLGTLYKRKKNEALRDRMIAAGRSLLVLSHHVAYAKCSSQGFGGSFAELFGLDSENEMFVVHGLLVSKNLNAKRWIYFCTFRTLKKSGLLEQRW